jgi:hypothetical protein
MTDYKTLLSDLGFSQEIIAALEGKYAVPSYILRAPFDGSYGYPPILIPLWSNDDWPGYVGVVTSWFGGDEHGFIKYYSEDRYASEIALTFEQLKLWLVFECLCDVPNVKKVGGFAESIGLCLADKVEDYFINCITYRDLANFHAFKAELPKVLSAGKENSHPDWMLRKVSKADVLSAIEAKDYHQAWLGINSPGLERGEILELLEKIAPFAGYRRFDDLVECWARSTGARTL